MNALALLDELHHLGVTVEARGGRIRFKPVDALPPELLAELRAQKRAVLDLLHNAEGPVSEITPYHRLEFDWQEAVKRAREGFARNATRPSHECLEAAAAIELGLADTSLPRQDVTANNVRKFLEEIYSGRLIARLAADGRIVLRPAATSQGAA